LHSGPPTEAALSFDSAASEESIVLDLWFAWHPVKTSKRIVWFDWVWRVREAESTRYVAPCF
jgi:hypothetical protein